MSATSDRVIALIKEQRLKVRSIQYTESGLVSTVSFFDTEVELHRVDSAWELVRFQRSDPITLQESDMAKDAAAQRTKAASLAEQAQVARTKAFVTEQLISLIKAANR